MRFKIGDKVVPIRKTAMCSLENCKEWKIGEAQGFLYVKGYWEDGYVLGAFQTSDSNSIYRFGDVVEWNENSDQEGKFLVEGVRFGDFTFSTNCYTVRGLHQLARDKDKVMFIGDFEGCGEGLTLKEVKRLKRYLDRFITYCEGVEI